MSAVVKTVTPFTQRELLLEALDELSVEYQEKGNAIMTERVDDYGAQRFIYEQGAYRFQHDSSPWRQLNLKEWKTVSAFLGAVEKAYHQAYERLQQRLAEEERRRLEEERQRFVEQQKQAVIQRATEQGYNVKEIRKSNKIQLQLVRTTY
ncbi:MAG TPA: hypothetical protein ENG03_12310 [Thioploca sp.]|nr:MAG: hypothetical protein B6247_20150 [Beggiatoa sp. 4572_84]RKZ63455.1 MAG: hypothetical protein DRR08_03280 [Gammaproteobacteria bacterium]HDN27849.1 hypothetical protein [Thioploca sp.]